jgi:pyruvate dehydrogenase E1 component
MPKPTPALTDADAALLKSIEQKLLWLSTLMIHHANTVRPNPDGTKIGGHQASSASSVSIITALYFHLLRSTDRVLIKPHAAPVFHGAMALMGLQPFERLKTLREFGGLQSYPSRTKDLVTVDFSAGSMGLGPVAPSFAALTQQYAQAHFGPTDSNRFIAMSGDAELDEGNIWETLIDEGVLNTPNQIWLIDLNRQSLDRVTPGVRADKLKAMFAECGWNVLEAKYGHDLQSAFAGENGQLLRRFIDDMANEEYQSLIRSEPAAIRKAMAARKQGKKLLACVADVPDVRLPALLANLGGHDMRELIGKFREAEQETQRPSVIFCYTIKGYGLPIAGDPANHAALISPERLAELRTSLGIDESSQWAGFAADSVEAALCGARAEALQLKRTARPLPVTPADIPADIGASQQQTTSTQEAFGRAMMRLADVPVLGKRIVTTSADVSISTNLGGWINKTGTFSLREATDYEAGRARILDWHVGPLGQHIELGIAEMNLFSLLGMLGLSHELNGELLLPIGTLYDPFVCRGLDAIIYGLYSGSRFIFVATPSGVTLAPEGGAHQSSVTASLGIELPELDYWEPTFAVELEWCLLEGLRQCLDRKYGASTYLRLSTKPIDQRLLEPALARLGRDALHRQMLAGGYALRMADAPMLNLVTCGVMLPEALAAADYLESEGVAVNVINLTSPRRAYDAWHAAMARGDHTHVLAELLPPAARGAPILTVHDAAPHALAWLGGVFGQKTHALGVTKFGQSGYRDDLYKLFHIDAMSIAAAGFALVDAES